MVKDEGLVVKDSNGFYYTGYNAWSNQLRKDKINNMISKCRCLICLLFMIICLSMTGCSDVSSDFTKDESIDNMLINGLATDLKLDNVFGNWYLNYRGSLYELGDIEIDDFRYDFALAENKNSGNSYYVVHLYNDDSYYIISRDYQNNGDILKLSNEQIEFVNEVDLDWSTYNFLEGIIDNE